MKAIAFSVFAISALSALAQSPSAMATSAGSAPLEQLGTVSFPVSCSHSQQASFNRGVALLHDFWYSEARAQFEQIAKADPNCAMAHWGIAMSLFRQIWERPDKKTMKLGWEQIKTVPSAAAKTDRERDYIGALAVFYRPGSEDFMARVTAYSAAMDALYRKYPDDVDAGAFYALSLLASEAPDDTSLKHEHDAMAVLGPLFARYPDNPGVAHYIVHSCDNPAMAQEGLAAAEHYGKIASSGPHAAHMPGHIFARLGMWPQDIEAQLASIQASNTAETQHKDGLMDEPHSYDFLMYAYLQCGQDGNAKTALEKSASVIDRISSMPDMDWMSGYYRTKFPVFYALERRDWQTAAALKPVAGAKPEVAVITWWARAIADGHLHRGDEAKDDLTQFDALIVKVKEGPNAYDANSIGTQVTRDEIVAWASFAAGQQDDALKHIRDAADLQDKVGQGEVDIPAREMLGDMLLELHRPQEALAEYRLALMLSPNRFNGLYNAGMAAEEAGDKTSAADYFASLLKSTGNGGDSTRPELAHAKNFVASERAETVQ